MVQGRRCGNLALRASPYLFSFDHSPRSLHRRHNNRVLHLRFNVTPLLDLPSSTIFFRTGSRDSLLSISLRRSKSGVLRGKASRNPSRAAILGHAESKYKHDLRRPILDGTEFREIRRESETKFLLPLNAIIKRILFKSRSCTRRYVKKLLFSLRISPFLFLARGKSELEFPLFHRGKLKEVERSRVKGDNSYDLLRRTISRKIWHCLEWHHPY